MGLTRSHDNPRSIGPTRWAGAARVAGILLASLLMLAQCAGTPGIAGGGPLPLIDPPLHARGPAARPPGCGSPAQGDRHDAGGSPCQAGGDQVLDLSPV